MLMPRNCQDCGAEYFGSKNSRYCPACRKERFIHCAKNNQPVSDDPGWRHMIRNAGGPALRPGGNVVHALRTLCDYEDACEAAGIQGPEALRKVLEEKRSKEERAVC